MEPKSKTHKLEPKIMKNGIKSKSITKALKLKFTMYEESKTYGQLKFCVP